MEDYVAIKVKDLQEGQTFWWSLGCCGDPSLEREIKEGAMIWTDGSDLGDFPCGTCKPSDKVYIKSIINTGDAMSKQDELNKLKLKQDHAKRTISGMERGRFKRELEIKALEAEIADAEKPKLRHGDYGITKSGAEFLYIDGNLPDDRDRNFFKGDRGCTHTKNYVKNNCSYGCTVLGNIFDDLTAMQEDVTEFKVRGKGGQATLTVSIEDGYISILDCIDENRVYLPQLDDFILKLRQMEATLKRNKK